MSIPPDRLLQLMERSNLATELLECQEEREALRRERNESREERETACNLLQGIATALAKAVGAEECPPVTHGNIHAVVDECLGRVARLAHDREERDAARAEAEKLRAELLKSDTLAWEALGKPGGTFETTTVERLSMAHGIAKGEVARLRAELAAERERFNLLSQRCDAAERERDAARIRGDDLAGRLAVAIAWRRSLARVCNDFIEAFDEHGVYDGLFYGSDSWLSALRAEVRSAQPTKSEVIAERDAARAEAEKLRELLRATEMGYEDLASEKEDLRLDLCEIAEGTGCNVPDRAEAKRRIIGLRAELDAWRSLGTEGEPASDAVARIKGVMEEHAQIVSRDYEAELAAVKRQRDELLARLPKEDEFPSWDELAMRPEIDERFGTRVRILNAAARERHEDPDLSVRKFVFEASRLHVRNLGAACAELLKAAVENWRAEQPKPQQPEHDPWRLDYGGPTKPQQTEVQP